METGTPRREKISRAGLLKACRIAFLEMAVQAIGSQPKSNLDGIAIVHKQRSLAFKFS